MNFSGLPNMTQIKMCLHCEACKGSVTSLNEDGARNEQETIFNRLAVTLYHSYIN